MTRYFRLLFTIAFFSACSGNSQGPIADPDTLTTQQEKRAVTEVVQTLNLPFDQTWATTVGILKAKGIQISINDAPKGKLVSKQVQMTERPCDIEPNTGVPIECKTTYSIKITALTEIASSVAISYKEECFTGHPFELECPESKAEQLMFRIVDDLRTAGGVINQ